MILPCRRATHAILVPLLAIVIAGCGGTPASAPASGATASDPSSVAPSLTPRPSTSTDLSAISCGTDDPTDVGVLTGAWLGSEGGMYYIRQIGSCVWWFGTELTDIERGVEGQGGFANVASGRMYGTRLEMQWADIPLGDVMGGGGLILVYDEQHDELAVVQQLGDWVPFGARVFTRFVPEPSTEASPSAS